MTQCTTLMTPSCLIDFARFTQNVARMKRVIDSKNVVFRPHVKTLKSLAAAEYYAPAGSPITVSTLAEAEYFAAAGYADILYAVGLVPNKFERVQALSERVALFTVVVDSLQAALALVEFSSQLSQPLQVMCEIDVDDHRAGILPASTILIECANAVNNAPMLVFRGVMTHAGGSYDCFTQAARDAMALQECQGMIDAVKWLSHHGIACELVSAGSTPTALANVEHQGINELRAGVHATFDCVMASLGVCEFSDIALSVLTSVIGHQSDKKWVLIDAGWMALSRDEGTAAHNTQYGYGLVCDCTGRLLDGWYVSATNQEHGIIVHRDGKAPDLPEFAYGSMLRILPIHACATAAQFNQYHVVNEEGEVTEVWPRITGW